MDVACGVSLDMAFLAGYGMLISQVIRPCMLPQLTSRLCNLKSFLEKFNYIINQPRFREELAAWE